MSRSHRVVDHIVESAGSARGGHIFGVDGANIEDLYDAAYFHNGLTAVLAKHEFAAGTMADGYARAGGADRGGRRDVGRRIVESRCSARGIVHQPSAGAGAGGAAARTMDGRGGFQDTSGANGSLDAEALFSAVSVFCRRVLDPHDIVTALGQALAAARQHGGPAVLLLPKDVQQSEIRPVTEMVPVPSIPLGNPAVIAERLRSARGPSDHRRR